MAGLVFFSFLLCDFAHTMYIRKRCLSGGKGGGIATA